MRTRHPLPSLGGHVTRRDVGEERGDRSDETERGKRRAWRIPRRGCILSAALLGLVVYGLYRFAIGLGSAWSISW